MQHTSQTVEAKRVDSAPYWAESEALRLAIVPVTPMNEIYLDNQATTPTDPRVVEAMLPMLATVAVGNPHSTHSAGHRAAEIVDKARSSVASLIGARSDEIVFTSGATEANNIAIQGLARAIRSGRNRFVTCVTEHKCVLEAMSRIATLGFKVDAVNVAQDGLVDMSMLERAITDETALVSVMLVNNEVGVVQPISQIAALCRERGAVLHTDAAQAVGKMVVDVKDLGVDLLSLSGHKLYAPIGIGALFVSQESRLRPEPLFAGGPQENGLRPGTVAPHLCAALGKACELAESEMEADAKRLAFLADHFLATICTRHPEVRVNGHRERRLKSNLSLTFPGIDADHLVGSLQPRLALSTGAACSAGFLQPSHVLLAMGLTAADADSTVRVGFGRFNTTVEVELAAELMSSKVTEIRMAAPYQA